MESQNKGKKTVSVRINSENEFSYEFYDEFKFKNISKYKS